MKRVARVQGLCALPGAKMKIKCLHFPLGWSLHVCADVQVHACVCSSLAPFRLDCLSSRRHRIWASVLDELRSHIALERVHRSAGLCETEDKRLCIEEVHKCISLSEIKGKGMCIFTGKLQSLSVREED